RPGRKAPDRNVRGVAAPEPKRAANVATPIPLPIESADHALVAEASAVDPHGSMWAEQELGIARAKIDAKLFDQALATLKGVTAREGVGEVATDAYFLMASI